MSHAPAGLRRAAHDARGHFQIGLSQLKLLFLDVARRARVRSLRRANSFSYRKTCERVRRSTNETPKVCRARGVPDSTPGNELPPMVDASRFLLCAVYGFHESHGFTAASSSGAWAIIPSASSGLNRAESAEARARAIRDEPRLPGRKRRVRGFEEKLAIHVHPQLGSDHVEPHQEIASIGHRQRR